MEYEHKSRLQGALDTGLACGGHVESQSNAITSARARRLQRVVANMSERHSGACELCLLAFLPHKSAQHKGRHVLRIAPYRCIKVSYLSCCRFHGHMV